MSHSIFRPAFGRGARSGFGRTELLVLLLVVFVLLVIAGGSYVFFLQPKWRLERAVESARTLSTLLSQYATDNNGVYPVGEGNAASGKSEGIARDLLVNNYTPDASIFAVGSTPAYSGTAHDFSDLGAANISWDFTAGATATTGITSAASDLLPVVYTTGQTVTLPTAPGTGLDLPASAQGPLGASGIVVGYKDTSAKLIQPAPGSSLLRGFLSPDFKDTATYTQIKP